ncbi:phosphoribosyltransferase [Salipiger aestuarii]|uniref:Phosphoribosyl transferase-like protein n=1 Tax=Salipiger aestuarii TaxID=568098 RepID=A0A327YPB2_9RHOB|nr:phosphoribosyltransferase [Salipiger aestuarii]KAA8613998.1 phosphoribosyltransferase [Salipiger aestuarii]KAB2543706.1 phosphoribosyltransferase [Salipiger aestuarii]RAK22944.1 phosphoribosyl transferase-like protein [Salipiger aestuarii]
MHPHEFWQTFSPGPPPPAPWNDRYPARMPDGRVLWLPIRTLTDGKGIASLILNQASFEVEETLAHQLAEGLRRHAPEVIVGLPTLGLGLARAVAARLGHARMVPLGTSRKFWYDEALSVPMSSITSPGADKRLYVDPRMLPLIQGRRVALIDDVASSGASMRAGLSLLNAIDCAPVAMGVAMRQTDRWRTLTQAPLEGVFDTPLLTPAPGGGWCENT